MKYCAPMRVQVMLPKENISERIEMPEGPSVGDVLYDILRQDAVTVKFREWIRDDQGWLLVATVTPRHGRIRSRYQLINEGS